jgi:hypothetical protein
MDHDQTLTSQSPAVLGYASNEVSPVAVVWCRLFALWLFVNGIDKLVIDLSFYVNKQLTGFRNPWDGWPASLANVGTWIVLGWLCWAEAPRLSLRITEGLAVEKMQPLPLQGFLRVLLLGIGVYAVTDGLPFVIRNLTAIKGPINSLGDLPWSEMSSSLSHVILGMAIIFANAKIAKFLLRRFGDADVAPLADAKVVGS